jgi:hypothetical protein
MATLRQFEHSLTTAISKNYLMLLATELKNAILRLCSGSKTKKKNPVQSSKE